MDEAELHTEIDALTIRRDEITDTIEDQPAPPEPATPDRIREHLAYVIAEGTSAERKATVEQSIAEIKLTEDDQVILVFRIPGPDATVGATTEEGAEPDTVRAMLHLVGRVRLEPGGAGRHGEPSGAGPRATWSWAGPARRPGSELVLQAAALARQGPVRSSYGGSSGTETLRVCPGQLFFRRRRALRPSRRAARYASLPTTITRPAKPLR